MINGKYLCFNSAKAGVKTGDRTAFLFSLLGQLGTNTLKGVAYWCASRGNVLITVIDFDRVVVVQRIS